SAPRIEERPANAPGNRHVTLAYPFKVNGKWLRVVTIHLPDTGDIDDYVSGTLPTLRDLLARLTRLSHAEIMALKWIDSAAVHQVFRDVLPPFIEKGIDA
ncbi:MAG: phage tail assembly protein, partial [Shinella sp.]|uniref:phage tail assembly protein n=1 Tax=Shinella sp. TaxID=1870904 RepID=UPI0040361F5C